jgi:hypothetical protein
MSASAVRGGQVYVEIGANPTKLLNALRVVNTQVGSLGTAMSRMGGVTAAVGSAIVGPIAALGLAAASNTAEMKQAQSAIADVGKAVGEAVAPAFVGMAKVVTSAAKAVSRFVRENQPLVRNLMLAGAALSGVGGVLFVVGKGLSGLSATGAALSNVFGPLASRVMALASALITIATSGPVLAIAGVLGGVAVVARSLGVDLAGLAAGVGQSLSGPLSGVISLFGDLGATASTTMAGVFNAVAAGDLAGAVDILWAGALAAWTRGTQAVMGALDPWTEAVQNVVSDLGVGLAITWDQVWTDIATSEWGGDLLGAMDNVMNALMATWDFTIGGLQMSWAAFSSWWSGDAAAMEKEIERINAANAANAAQRGQDRPGFAGRTGLSEEEKDRMRQESADRQNAMREEAQKMRDARAARTASNVTNRANAVKEANAALQQKVGSTAEPPPVTAPGAKAVGTAVAGTFSAFGVEQMAGGGNVQKQQLDALLKIQAGIEEANRAGVVIA